MDIHPRSFANSLRTIDPPRRRSPPLAAAILLGALLCSAPVPLLAQSSDSDSAETSEEGSETGAADADERAESIDDLPTKKKKKLLKLLQSAREDYANGQFEQVVDQMERAHDIYPDPEFLFRIALSHERMGDREEAIEHYEKYLEQKPETQKRGRVQRSLGQLREALREEREEERRAGTAPPTGAPAGEQDSGTSNTLPVVLTSVGGAMAGAAVTFGVLNLQAKSNVDSMRDNPRSEENSLQEFEGEVSDQNLFAGLTIGTGAVAVGALTWAVFEWTGPAGEAQTSSSDSEGPRVQPSVGVNSVGLSGSF